MTGRESSSGGAISCALVPGRHPAVEPPASANCCTVLRWCGLRSRQPIRESTPGGAGGSRRRCRARDLTIYRHSRRGSSGHMDTLVMWSRLTRPSRTMSRSSPRDGAVTRCTARHEPAPSTQQHDCGLAAVHASKVPTRSRRQRQRSGDHQQPSSPARPGSTHDTVDNDRAPLGRALGRSGHILGNRRSDDGSAGSGSRARPTNTATRRAGIPERSACTCVPT